MKEKKANASHSLAIMVGHAWMAREVSSASVHQVLQETLVTLPQTLIDVLEVYVYMVAGVVILEIRAHVCAQKGTMVSTAN